MVCGMENDRLVGVNYDGGEGNGLISGGVFVIIVLIVVVLLIVIVIVVVMNQNTWVRIVDAVCFVVFC